MRVPSEKRFDAAADHYRDWRPGYPKELLDWVIGTSGVKPPSPIADIGCGTGISTRAFAARGFDVIGIDPSQAMLDRALAAGGARYRRGSSTETGLADRSLPLVISAQAFHWFDIPSTFAELRRVLVPGGWCAAFWNLRGSSPFLDEYEALLYRRSEEYASVPKPLPTIEAIAAAPGAVNVRRAEFPHSHDLDREGLLGRALSSSYVVHGVEDRAAFEKELLALFENYATGGRVRFLYRAIAIAWQIPG